MAVAPATFQLSIIIIWFQKMLQLIPPCLTSVVTRISFVIKSTLNYRLTICLLELLGFLIIQPSYHTHQLSTSPENINEFAALGNLLSCFLEFYLTQIGSIRYSLLQTFVLLFFQFI